MPHRPAKKSSVKRGRAMENTVSEAAPLMVAKCSHRAAKMGSAVIRLRSTLPRRAMCSESQDNRNFSSFLEVAGLRACWAGSFSVSHRFTTRRMPAPASRAFAAEPG
jgi:hypothetical protein